MSVTRSNLVLCEHFDLTQGVFTSTYPVSGGKLLWAFMQSPSDFSAHCVIILWLTIKWHWAIEYRMERTNQLLDPTKYNKSKLCRLFKNKHTHVHKNKSLRIVQTYMWLKGWIPLHSTVFTNLSSHLSSCLASSPALTFLYILSYKSSFHQPS